MKHAGDEKNVMIFSDSRTNPSKEGEDDKNQFQKIQKTMSTKDSKNYFNNRVQTCTKELN